MWALGYIDRAGGRIDSSFYLEHPEAARYARERAAELVKGIDEWTRTRIRQVLERAFNDAAVSEREVADAINQLFDGFDAVRARQIARTEMAYANGHGSSSAWRSIGVEYVAISDGLDVDLACAEADGQIWTLEFYENNILEHPNCTRAASPMLGSEVNPEDVSSPY